MTMKKINSLILSLILSVVFAGAFITISFADTEIFEIHEYELDECGQYFTLDFVSGADVEKVTSSNTKVVSVEDDDIYDTFVYLYAEDVGTAVITATDSSGNSDTCTVTVLPEPFYLDYTQIEMTDYGEYDEWYVHSETNDIKSVVSSDTSIAKVRLDEKSYFSITPVKAGKVTITAKDIYGQTATVALNITQKYIDESKYLSDLEDVFLEMSYGTSELYIGLEFSGAEFSVVAGGKTYKAGAPECEGQQYYYTVNGLPLLPAGTKINYTIKKGAASYSSYIIVEKANIDYNGDFEFNENAKTYNGKAQTPAVTVWYYFDSGIKTLVPGKDYTVTYSNNKNVGTATITITGKGNYGGTDKGTFKIIPKKTSIKKVLPDKNGFTVNWKRNKTQTSGYQIQYSLKSNFSGAKNVTVKKNSTVSKKVTKLKANTKYYVRIRTYKTVKGTKYYSAWSPKKKVKTK